jgi:hypothetical protein
MATSFSTLYTQLAARLNDTAFAVWRFDRMKQLVNDAIVHWYDVGGYQEVTDERTATNATGVEYTLPAAITNRMQVIEITVEQGAGEPYASIGSQRPRLIQDGSTVKLLVDSAFASAGKKLRIRYKTAYPALVQADDETEVPAEFIYAWARYLAHGEAAGRPSQANAKMHAQERDVALRDFNMLLGALLARVPRPQREHARANW